MNQPLKPSDEAIDMQGSKTIKAMTYRKLIVLCLIISIILVAGFTVKSAIDGKQTDKLDLPQAGAEEISSKEGYAKKSQQNNGNVVPNQVNNLGASIGGKAIVDSCGNRSVVEDSFKVPR
jgi:hypothetical protein